MSQTRSVSLGLPGAARIGTTCSPGKGQGSVRQWATPKLVCVGRRSRSSECVDGHRGRRLASQSLKGSMSEGRAPGRCPQSAPGLRR